MKQPIHRILLVHHTHTDIGYTHSQPVVWRLHRQFIDDAIQLCERTSGLDPASRVRWTCEVTSTLVDWLSHAEPEQIARFRRLVELGQMSGAAFFVNMTPMYGVAETQRSMIYMQRLRETLELPFKMAINHDVNGLPWATVGMLLDAGVETLMMGLNPHFGGFPLTRPLVFDWEGPDGRTIRTLNAEHYRSFHRWMQPEKRSLDAMSEGFNRYIESLGRRLPNYPHAFIVLSATHFDFVDNNPPDPLVAEMVASWNAAGREPRIEFVTSDQLADELLSVPKDVVPTERGDWPDYWNFGCGSAAREARIQRQTKARLRTIDAIGGPAPEDQGDLEQAWWNALMFDEHTWGSWAATWNNQADDVPAGIVHKFAYAYEARSLTSWVLRRALDFRIGNPSEAVADGIPMTHLALINAAPLARSVTLTTTTRVQPSRWVHYPSRLHNLDVRPACLTDEEEWEIGPFHVPAASCKVVSVNQLQATAPPPNCKVEESQILSPYYQLEIDPATGDVASVIDRETNREIYDAASRWDFFGYVLESVDASRHQGRAKYHGRDAFFDTDFDKLSVDLIPGWKPNWPAMREKPGPPDSHRLAMHPLGPRLTLSRGQVPGATNLTISITLAADRKAIFLDAEFEKNHTLRPEGIYLTFPLPLANWRSWYDSASVCIELDEEQLAGSVRDYQTVETFVGVADAHHAVVLACPDAPMVQIGDFNFCKCLSAVPRDDNCLLLAWPMNTYWDTNFPASQPGYQRFHYELTSQSTWDSQAACAFGQTAATPVEIHPVLRGSEGRANRLQLNSVHL